MCEYSLEYIAFKPAQLGDKLVTMKFPNSLTCGFVQLEDSNVAVCLQPGTELAFEKEVERQHPLAWLSARLRQMGAKVARFRQVNLDKSWAHHDALEFPDGRIVLLTRLCPGQRATVLQLPVELKTTSAPNRQASRQAQPGYVG
jgi:hypothetical protein